VRGPGNQHYPQGDSKKLRKHGENEVFAIGQRAERRAGHDFDPLDPELTRVVRAWPHLPEGTRRAILDLIDRATKPQDGTGDHGQPESLPGGPERGRKRI
jgi:hypothetical protein